MLALAKSPSRVSWRQRCAEVLAPHDMVAGIRRVLNPTTQSQAIPAASALHRLCRVQLRLTAGVQVGCRVCGVLGCLPTTCSLCLPLRASAQCRRAPLCCNCRRILPPTTRPPAPLPPTRLCIRYLPPATLVPPPVCRGAVWPAIQAPLHVQRRCCGAAGKVCHASLPGGVRHRHPHLPCGAPAAEPLLARSPPPPLQPGHQGSQHSGLPLCSH